MENCPYCNEFMELASDTQECTHISNDPRGEYCCLNCNAHFDLDLQEVTIDEGIGKNPSTPTNPTPPAQNPSQDSTQESNKGDSSDTESSKGDSKEDSKGDSSDTESNKDDSSKEDSKENPSTPQEPQKPQPPQNLTLANKNQIALAKQIYASLQSYNAYTKIHTDIIPILQSLQDYLAQKHTKIIA